MALRDVGVFGAVTLDNNGAVTSSCFLPAHSPLRTVLKHNESNNKSTDKLSVVDFRIYFTLSIYGLSGLSNKTEGVI